MLDDFFNLKPILKKLTSLFFILPGFAPLLFIIIFTVKQQAIRHRMKERMENQSLHSITLANNEIDWVKKGKEIRVNGKMFDIKSITCKNGLITFYGLYDEEETILKTVFETGCKKNMTAEYMLLGQLFQCLQGVYFPPPVNNLFLSMKQLHEYSLNTPKIKSRFKTILTPPPQV